MKQTLSKKEPEKRLLKFIGRKSGRSNTGRITVRHQGGGAKRLYRLVDFGQSRLDRPATVLSLEYDPYRTAFLALLEYENKEKAYIIASQGLKIGDKVIASESGELRPGNRFRLKNISVGTMVFNIELDPGRGGKLVRSAGTAAKILAQESGNTHLLMPSSEVRKVSGDCFATVGIVSNEGHVFEDLGKAGRNRYRGVRPTVRGTAMNPVDHPHGGGEGKTPIGMKHPKTPWGKPARGVKTRRAKWTDRFILQRRTKH